MITTGEGTEKSAPVNNIDNIVMVHPELREAIGCGPAEVGQSDAIYCGKQKDLRPAQGHVLRKPLVPKQEVHQIKPKEIIPEQQPQPKQQRPKFESKPPPYMPKEYPRPENQTSGDGQNWPAEISDKPLRQWIKDNQTQ